MAENLEGDELDSIRRRVLLDVARILESDPDVYLSLTCEAGVWFPHSGERLENQPCGNLKCTGLYFTSAEGEGSCTVMSCEGVEDRLRIPVRDK